MYVHSVVLRAVFYGGEVSLADSSGVGLPQLINMNIAPAAAAPAELAEVPKSCTKDRILIISSGFR